MGNCETCESIDKKFESNVKLLGDDDNQIYNHL